MDDMLPFLRAIAAEPGDDTPRLAFADWLDEYGQHPRAEFIRLQIELERMDALDDGYAEKTARMRRCGVLTQKGKVRFFDYLPTAECKIAFRRGFIDGIHTWGAKQIDDSGFDLVPLLALHAPDKLLKSFRRFTKLKCLTYSVDHETGPERLLELFGPGGWFTELDRLNLSGVGSRHFEAGVIPQFDLPNLRTFHLDSAAFYELGRTAERETDPDEDDYSRPEWLGWPDHLPRNALLNPTTPLERFAWHSEDDSDYYRDGDPFWPGPTMSSLLKLLQPFNLKQLEVAVYWDDHEGGGEGPRAAPHDCNPLDIVPSLERVTFGRYDHEWLTGARGRLKGLRVYDSSGRRLRTLLARPVCAELESLAVSNLDGWEYEPLTASSPTLTNLRSAYPLEAVADHHLPNLISASASLKTISAGRWPKLQTLHARVDKFADLQAFAHSDCCPNLTTLVIVEYFDGYYDRVDGDFSFLADCPHMPLLSLVRLNGYRAKGTYVVDGGQLIPVREDVLIDGLEALSPSNLPDPFA